MTSGMGMIIRDAAFFAGVSSAASCTNFEEKHLLETIGESRTMVNRDVVFWVRKKKKHPERVHQVEFFHHHAASCIRKIILFLDPFSPLSNGFSSYESSHKPNGLDLGFLQNL